jgi:GLPGLI family protein
MKCLLLCVIILISNAIGAQHSFVPKGPRDIASMSVVDSGNIRVCYAVNNHSAYLENFKPLTKGDSMFLCSLCAEDIHLLEIGEKLSKYYSYNVFMGDSIFTDFMIKNPFAQSAPNRNGRNPTISNKYFWSEYYKEYAKNMLTEYAYMPSAIPNYYYLEKIPDFVWTVQEDTLTVVGYLCQKATCTFRGKNYTAWFASDFPISNGPWKFGGLPGLILKVYDDRDDYIFECVGIEYHENKFAIKSHNHDNYAKTDRKKLLKLWSDIFDHFYQLIGAKTMSGKYPSKKLPYKPFELE